MPIRSEVLPTPYMQDPGGVKLGYSFQSMALCRIVYWITGVANMWRGTHFSA